MSTSFLIVPPLRRVGVQPGDIMIDLSSPTYGPLSPKTQECFPELLQADAAVLQQADNDPYVLDHFRVLRLGQYLGQRWRTLRLWVVVGSGRGAFATRRVIRGGLGRIDRGTFRLRRGGRSVDNRQGRHAVASLIEGALLVRVLPVIGGRAPDRFPSLVLLPAPERAPHQVQTPVVAPMGKKEDAAMPAPAQALLLRQRFGSSH